MNGVSMDVEWESGRLNRALDVEGRGKYTELPSPVKHIKNQPS